MRMFPSLLAATTLLALSGCVTAEELRQADVNRCTSYGFQPNTPEFAGCLQKESLARRYAPPPYYGPGWAPGWGVGGSAWIAP